MALMANSAVFSKCHPYLYKRIKAERTTWTYLKKYASVSGNVFWHQMWYVKADLELNRHSYMLFVHFKKSLFAFLFYLISLFCLTQSNYAHYFINYSFVIFPFVLELLLWTLIVWSWPQQVRIFMPCSTVSSM